MKLEFCIVLQQLFEVIILGELQVFEHLLVTRIVDVNGALLFQ